MMKCVGRWFVRGLIAVLPITVTIYFLYWLGTTAELHLGGLLKRFIDAKAYVPGMGVAVGVLVILLVGILVQAAVVRWMLAAMDRLAERIPLVKTVYGAVKDMIGMFDSSKPNPYNQVVLVDVPPLGRRVIGLVTRNEFNDEALKTHCADAVAVYVPMSYQIGGFTIIVSRSEITPIDLSVEQAMRFALTAGVSTDQPKR